MIKFKIEFRVFRLYFTLMLPLNVCISVCSPSIYDGIRLSLYREKTREQQRATRKHISPPFCQHQKGAWGRVSAILDIYFNLMNSIYSSISRIHCSKLSKHLRNGIQVSTQAHSIKSHYAVKIRHASTYQYQNIKFCTEIFKI